VTPVAVRAKDELAEMADAFNAVGRAAVELAAKQAATRQGVADMFVNLGRRNQALINRQLTFIDQLERDEQDPDTLEDLFRLDHLATRMRRNAESLLVLAGAEQARRWTESVDVANVVRGALSEIEEYNQVALGDLERVLVRGTVVADLAHLLAELLENATAFSPPASSVSVSGRMMSEGYVISIVDEGIGMEPKALDEANGRIDASSHLDEAPSRVLGLYVVGRLAARHGIRVRLVPSHERGITARVLLPMTTFETPRAPQTPVQAVALADAQVLNVAMDRLREEPPVVDAQLIVASVAAPAPVATAAATAPPTTPTVQVLPAVPAAIVESRPTSTGLTRRVRGAQLPDTGPARSDEPPPPPRSADDVRALLTRFRGGVDRGLEEVNGTDDQDRSEPSHRNRPARTKEKTGELHE
jgi:anti-sigma regulatory factor (Ser/Thr protein kinase)